MLSDFDEGKRSCRRKLERHNNRRRRKPVDSRGAVDKEPQGDLHVEDVSSDGEAGKGIANIQAIFLLHILCFIVARYVMVAIYLSLFGKNGNKICAFINAHCGNILLLMRNAVSYSAVLFL